MSGQATSEPVVLAQGETGYISGLWTNEGTYRLDLNVSLNITLEGFNIWEPGEDMGYPIDLSVQNESYFANYTMHPSYKGNSSAEYMKGFTAKEGYESTNYTARANLTYLCDGQKKSRQHWVNFMIVSTTGESGGVDIANNTGSPVPEDINSTGDLENATIETGEGDDISDETHPENYSAEGDQTINQTFPQDVNMTGEQSDTPLEGNNDAPGVTPTPEPEPEPEPEPRMEVNIEPVNRTYHANQSQFIPVELEISNIGTENVEQLSVQALIDDLREGWQVEDASVSNLSVNQTVTREVFVRPPEDAEPGLYVSPVKGLVDGERADLDYFTVKVHEVPEPSSALKIVESPRSVRLNVNESRNLPILLENNGRRELTNVTARLQNFDECGTAEIPKVDRIPVNETASLNIQLSTESSPARCNTTMIVSSDQGAYSFSNVEFSITPEEGLIPQQFQVPFISVLWTSILAAFAVLKKRFGFDSVAVKLPLILLMMGETVIILYLAANYYGIISVAFLPF